MEGPDPDVMAAVDRGNAVVFFDVMAGEGNNASDLGRIKMELFVKDVSEIVVHPCGDDFEGGAYSILSQYSQISFLT